MKTIHYPNKIGSHLGTIAPMVPFTPKSTSKLSSALSALHFRYLIVFIPALIRLNSNNQYTHGFHNTFDYNHFTNSD